MTQNHLHISSDLDLINEAIAGNQYSFAKLVTRHQSRVASTAMNMIGNMDEAEEIGQQTFIRFYKSMARFRGQSKLSTYLTRIAINLSINHLKRKAKINKRSIALEDAMHVATTNHWKTVDNKQVMNLALQQLKPKQRSAIVLHKIQGYSTIETANILGIPKGTVLSRVKRGMDSLKIILTEDLQYEHS